jgi:cytochrome c oxidase cbb3-type subunit III
MKFTILMLLVSGSMWAQGNAASPAARPRPKSSASATYTAAEIRSGAGKFTSQCGFCHGRDADGGEGGPDLTRSEIVATDARGDKLGPFLATGRPEQGMPAFKLKPADLTAIAAYIHEQKTKLDALGGGRQQVSPQDLATGDAQAGLAYFNANCSRCHAAAGDLKGVATRFQGLALIQRMLYPTIGRPAPSLPKVTVTPNGGAAISGTLQSEDEFSVVVNVGGIGTARQTFQKNAARVVVDNPMTAHFDQLGKYTDAEMHNVYAFLATLK